MQRNKETQELHAMNELQKKIRGMEMQLQSSSRVQADLERMCSLTIQQLQDREEEVKTIRFQMKRQVNSNAIQIRNSQDGLIGSMGKLVGTFFWGSTSGSLVGLVRPINDYRLCETRGNRKDGRVKKAVYLPDQHDVALKRVQFQRPTNEPSVLSSLVSSWFASSKPELADPQKERAQASLNFREAMLLFKLQNDYIIRLENIVDVSPVRLFPIIFFYFLNLTSK
jgi:hypothetical protein